MGDDLDDLIDTKSTQLRKLPVQQEVETLKITEDQVICLPKKIPQEWWDTKTARLFKRYDFDESGTLNSKEEAMQLTLNLGFAIQNEFSMRLPSASALETHVAALPPLHVKENELSLVKFQHWYLSVIMPLTATAQDEPHSRSAAGAIPGVGGLHESIDMSDPATVTAHEIFMRYDLDNSQTCNSWEEAKQITVNILLVLAYAIHPDEADARIAEMNVGGTRDCQQNPMNFPEYWVYFQELFGPPGSVLV